MYKAWRNYWQKNQAIIHGLAENSENKESVIVDKKVVDDSEMNDISDTNLPSNTMVLPFSFYTSTEENSAMWGMLGWFRMHWLHSEAHAREAWGCQGDI